MYKNNLYSQNINRKKVKFNEDIKIIDVECWKEYNLENQNITKSPFFNMKSGNAFSSKFNSFGLGQNNKLVRNSTAFKSKIISNIFQKEKISCTCLIIWFKWFYM